MLNDAHHYQAVVQVQADEHYSNLPGMDPFSFDDFQNGGRQMNSRAQQMAPQPQAQKQQASIFDF